MSADKQPGRGVRIAMTVLALAALCGMVGAVFYVYAPRTPEQKVHALLREVGNQGDGTVLYRLRSFVSGLPYPISDMDGLFDLFEDRDEDYRHYAVRSLMLFNDPAALSALEAAREDRDGTVRRSATAAVRQLQR